MPVQTCPIVLASGLTLADPWILMSRMREEPDWYPVYDGVPDFPDDDLGSCEITLSIMLNSGIRTDEATELFLKAARDPLVSSLLHRLRGIELQDAEYAHLVAFAELIDRLRVKGVALSTLSKILHKKRPGFIPVLDSIVQDHYRHILRKGLSGRWKGRTEPKEAIANPLVDAGRPGSFVSRDRIPQASARIFWDEVYPLPIVKPPDLGASSARLWLRYEALSSRSGLAEAVQQKASMWPRSRERGNRSRRRGWSSSKLLQCGRAHASAETRPKVYAPPGSVRLQCGRAHVSAETRYFIAARLLLYRLQCGRAHVSAETRAAVG